MTIYGLDFSHYDVVPVGSRVLAEGFAFMTHKAGGDADDAELNAWWKAMQPYQDRILLGAYWVLYPGSPTTRADKFIARLDSQCKGWRDGPFILQVDCEKWNNDASTVPSKAEIKAFCDRLVAKAPELRPIVYAPEWVYGDKLSGLGYPLWASRYVTGVGPASALYPGDSSSRWDSYSGQVPAILQFTSSANAVGQTTCDANAYRGTLAELIDLVAPGWETDMAITVQDILNGIYRDLGNDASGISQQLDRHLDAAVARALNSAQPFAGSVGTRVNGRGWNPLSPWVLLEYLFEAIVASGDRVLTDGTDLPGSVQSRLDRIENATDALTAPPADPES